MGSCFEYGSDDTSSCASALVVDSGADLTPDLFSAYAVGGSKKNTLPLIKEDEDYVSDSDITEDRMDYLALKRQESLEAKNFLSRPDENGFFKRPRMKKTFSSLLKAGALARKKVARRRAVNKQTSTRKNAKAKFQRAKKKYAVARAM